MNAYELADDLEGWCDDVLSNQNRKNVFKKHAKMLRQQADRIADLETTLAFKKMKPLSDEEIDSIIYSVDWAYDPVLLARAIEERHGIK